MDADAFLLWCEHQEERFELVDGMPMLMTGARRRPDVGVECGPMDDDALSASPWAVIEVLSPSTRAYDLVRKLDEYKTIASLCHVIVVDPDEPQAAHWHRTGADTWASVAVEGIGAVIRLNGLDLDLALAGLFEGLTFRTPPRLVGDGG